MKKTKLLVIFSLVALFTTTIVSLNIHPIRSTTETISDKPVTIRVGTIGIYANGDFATYASSGNGSASSPWIIENLIVNGNGSGYIFEIDATTDHFIIRHCVLFNTTTTAVYCFQVDNGAFINNTITGVGTAIEIQDGSNFQVINNTLTLNTGNGVETNDYVNYVDVVNNTITHNGGYGIYLWGHNNSVITENTIKNNTNSGMVLDNLCVNNTITYNTLDNNTRGLEIQDRSNYNRIKYNTMNNNSEYGIYLDHRQNNYTIFLNNTANYNVDTGFYSDENSHNTLINNTFNGNDYYGIHLGSSSLNFTLINNEASHNRLSGIYVECPNNTLTLNTANNNEQEHGIHLEYSDNNNLTLNTANNNFMCGIFVEDSDNNTVTWNVLHENGVSVLPSGTSSGNVIVNNSAIAASLANGYIAGEGTYTFVVIYTDIDNLAPFSIRVVIDGTPYDMNKSVPSDNTYTDGCTYTFSIALAQAPQGYYFEAYDITHRVTHTPVPDGGGIPGFSLLMLLIPLLGLSLVYIAFKKQKVF